MPTTKVAKPTSLKLPAGLQTQLETVAQKSGLSVHAYMVKALADTVRRANLREAFSLDSLDSLDALNEMKTSGLGHELSDVRAYFSQLAAHREGRQSKPADLSPTPLE